MTGFEVTLGDGDAEALGHAAKTLRWLVSKTERGWSHPEVDATSCARWADLLENRCFEACEQAKRKRVIRLELDGADASAIGGFIATVGATERSGFEDTTTKLRAILAALSPLSGPHQRGRLSVLAE
jgi:hypothetical protein